MIVIARDFFFFIRLLVNIARLPFEFPKRQPQGSILGAEFLSKHELYRGITPVHTSWKTSKLHRSHRKWWEGQIRKNNRNVVVIWTDDCVDKFIASKLGLRSRYLSRLHDFSFGQMRADVFRYHVIYEFGGIWVDVNKGFKKSFEDIFGNQISCLVVSYESNINIVLPEKSQRLLLKHPFNVFCQWSFAAEKGNQFLSSLIADLDMNLELLESTQMPITGRHIVATTGPGAFHTALIRHVDKGLSFKQIGIDFNGFGIIRVPGSWAIEVSFKRYSEKRDLGQLYR